MSIFDRLQLLLRSEWNARPGSRPANEARRLVGDARSTLASVVDDERKLRRLYQDALDEVTAADEEAVRAVERKDDEAARKALLRKRRMELEAEQLQRQLRIQQDQLVQLQGAVDAMQRRLREQGAADEAPPWRRDLGPAPEPGGPRFESLGQSPAGQPGGRPPWGRGGEDWAPPSTSLSSSALDRFDDMERRIETTEALGEAARLLTTPDGRSFAEQPGDLEGPIEDPLADDLEARFRRLELEAFKRDQGAADDDPGTGGGGGDGDERR